MLIYMGFGLIFCFASLKTSGLGSFFLPNTNEFVSRMATKFDDYLTNSYILFKVQKEQRAAL